MIQTTLTKNAGTGDTMLARRGPAIRDCVDTCDRGKSVGGTDPEIGLPENQHGQKHGNSDNTVVISDEFTI